MLGRVADALGRRKGLAAAFVLAGAATTALVLAPSFPLFLAAYGLQGAGVGGLGIVWSAGAPWR